MKREQCTFLQESVEDSLQTSSSDTRQLSLLSGMPMPAKSSENEQQKDGSQNCECGKEMSDCLTRRLTPAEWTGLMSSMLDSLVRTFRERGISSDWEKEQEAAYTVKSFALLASYDPNTFSWRTSQQSLIPDLGQSLQTWPRWGWTRGGSAYAHRMSGRVITETDGFYLPTPSGTSNHGKNNVTGRLDEWGGSSNPWRGKEIGKVHCAAFEEWMLGLPFKWTELTGSETPRSRSKQQQPTDCLGAE